MNAARLDAILVAGLGGAAVLQLVSEHASPVVWLVAAAVIAPLGVRRRFPIAACLAVLAADVGMWALGWHLVGDAAAGLAVYSGARYARWPKSLAALAAAQLWVGAVLLAGNVDDWTDVLGAAPVMAGIWWLGVMVHRNRHQTALLRALADRLRHEQAANARRAVVEERARIARELHDTVSHHLTAIAVQAHASRLSVAEEPEWAAGGLEHIARSAGAALDDMRLMLDLLRPDENDAQAPTLADLDGLFADARRAGLRLETETGPPPADLSGAVQTSVYRVVQESLTNVIKHAGAVAVRIRLAYGAEEVVVTVENDPGTPAGGPAGAVPGAGAGLAGMRARVAAFGGRLTAGPGPSGGFLVSAVIPVRGGEAHP
ncbi:sensor histidine kinase [Actinomadura sp. 6N118]|uniref:sensor histidine kinase n=1 Tax=Actinomadura sp. 6N118 TaxID=3375151 RepID=UPI00379B511E